MVVQYFSDQLVAGCDEAGRGCLAGPVFAAAVVLPSNFSCPGLDDSKKINPQKRLVLRKLIEEKALYWAVAKCSHKEIDRINILRASIRAMHKALQKLSNPPHHILVDGNRFEPFLDIPHTCIIGGDGKYASIAAASILAKTYRDDYMLKLSKKHPEYGWIHNKGYPTQYHRDAIVQFGVSAHHRRSFRLLPDPSKLK